MAQTVGFVLGLTCAGGGGGGVGRNGGAGTPTPQDVALSASGGGLLYLHAFTSIVPIGSSSIPTVRVNGDDGVFLPDWFDGGPGGMCRKSPLLGY